MSEEADIAAAIAASLQDLDSGGDGAASGAEVEGADLVRNRSAPQCAICLGWPQQPARLSFC